jgi:hypothetical protein
MFLTINSYAGVDFTLMGDQAMFSNRSGYVRIPTFTSKERAENFGKLYVGNDYVEKKLVFYIELHATQCNAFLFKYKKTHDEKYLDLAETESRQNQFCWMALKAMHDAAQLGAETYIGEMPMREVSHAI